MTNTNEKTYRDLSEIGIEELEQLMQLLKDVKVSPSDLLSYALALDTIDCHEENMKDEDCRDMTLEDCLEVNHECEAEDGDMADAMYSGARLCLVKMGKLEAH